MSPVRITRCPPTECVPWSARSPPWTPHPTRLATVPLPKSSSCVRVGNQYVADEGVEIRTSGNELAQSSPGRTERIEFFDGQTAVAIGSAKIRKFLEERIHDMCRNGIVDSWTNLYIAGVEANLPGMGRRDDHISANELAPMHVVAKGGREQTN